MTTLIYKRTHSGDPDPETGAFGNRNCMGKIRGWSFNAVIGIGGVGRQAQRHYLDGRLAWIGVGARKDGDPHCPLVTFDHFLHYVRLVHDYEIWPLHWRHGCMTGT
jgi:hypothetical protein